MGIPLVKYCPPLCDGWPYEALSVCNVPTVDTEYEGYRYCASIEGFPRDPSRDDGTVGFGCPVPSLVFYRACKRTVTYNYSSATVEVGLTSEDKDTINIPSATITETSYCILSPFLSLCSRYGAFSTDYALPRSRFASGPIDDVFTRSWDAPWVTTTEYVNYLISHGYYEQFHESILCGLGAALNPESPFDTSHLGASWSGTVKVSVYTAWTYVEVDVSVNVVVEYIDQCDDGPQDWYNNAVEIVNGRRFGYTSSHYPCLQLPEQGVIGWQQAHMVRANIANSIGNAQFFGAKGQIQGGIYGFADNYTIKLRIGSVSSEFVGAIMQYRPRYKKRTLCISSIDTVFGNWVDISPEPWLELVIDRVTDNDDDFIYGPILNIPEPLEGEQVAFAGFEFQSP